MTVVRQGSVVKGKVGWKVEGRCHEDGELSRGSGGVEQQVEGGWGRLWWAGIVEA